jgi:hypothetical protein
MRTGGKAILMAIVDTQIIFFPLRLMFISMTHPHTRNGHKFVYKLSV